MIHGFENGRFKGLVLNPDNDRTGNSIDKSFIADLIQQYENTRLLIAIRSITKNVDIQGVNINEKIQNAPKLEDIKLDDPTTWNNIEYFKADNVITPHIIEKVRNNQLDLSKLYQPNTKRPYK